MNHQEKMHQLACEAREKAYTPYLDFKVGACILTKNQQYFLGCNVQNAALPVGFCAEGCAIGNMLVAGEHEIKEIMVVADSDFLCAPCGACRQNILEFASKDTLIHMADLNGIRKTMTMTELLPESFSAKTIG